MDAAERLRRDVIVRRLTSVGAENLRDAVPCVGQLQLCDEIEQVAELMAGRVRAARCGAARLCDRARAHACVRCSAQQLELFAEPERDGGKAAFAPGSR